MATDPVGLVEWVCPECGSEWTTAQPHLNNHKFQCTTMLPIEEHDDLIMTSLLMTSL